MLRSNPSQWIAWPVLVISIILMLFLTFSEYSKALKEIEKSVQIKEIAFGRKVFYSIDKGDGNIKTYLIAAKKGLTVFSLLKDLAEREGFEIDFTLSPQGIFIESIDGLRNGTDNKFWQCWVNGELLMIEIDKKEIREGDKVEWKFISL